MSMHDYLINFPGTDSDKQIAWLKQEIGGNPPGTLQDLWAQYLAAEGYANGTMQDRQLLWARVTSGLGT